MTAEGVSFLANRSLLKVEDKSLAFLPTPQLALPLEDPVITAIETRALSIDSSYSTRSAVKDAIRRTVTHVMMAQGMTVARSLLNEEDVGGYDLDALICEAFRHEPPPVAVQKTLRRAIAEVLRDPSLDCAKGLFDLANAAYSLELLFLNPLEAPAWDLLKWKIFLDSNVVLRLTAPVSKLHQEFKRLVDRCIRIGVPVSVLHPFLEECVAHVESVAAVLDAIGAKTKTSVREYLETIHENERSPILEWYYAALQRASKWLAFREFARKEHLTSVSNWATLLWEKHTVSTEEPDKPRK